jgi:ArsR family transcriptional regulator, arsenate/arsenite/antimonite-responsive transcriptional repressor
MKYHNHMQLKQTVHALGALAHAHRLAIYRLLVEAGPTGLSAGDIAERVGLLPSSLTFHAQSLQRSGLVTQTRVSRQQIYAADFTVMNGLIEYLTQNCCGGDGSCQPAGQRVCKPVVSRSSPPRRRKSA